LATAIRGTTTTTKNDFLTAILQLSAEKNLPKEVVFEAVEAALASAYKKDALANANLVVKIDPATGGARVFAQKTVVEEVEDPKIEITLDEAKAYDASTYVGDTVNIAARVQGLTSQFADSNILITDATLAALGEAEQILVVDHGEIVLKGKTKLVRVYGVIGTHLAHAQPVLRVGAVPRRDVLEALYLYCRGFSLATIALTKKATPDAARGWLQSAADHFDAASQELRLEFGLTEAELQRLKEYAREGAPADAPPLAQLTTSEANAEPEAASFATAILAPSEAEAV